VSEVVRGKALAHLVENAKVTDASGNEVELKTLQPDGTYAEAEAAAAEPVAEAESPASSDEAPADEPAKA
jgi:trigger factor